MVEQALKAQFLLNGTINMINTYAKLDPNTQIVLNVQLADSFDVFDQDFIWIDTTNTNPVSIGWVYDPTSNSFSNFITDAPVDTTLSYMSPGTQTTFAPFNLSGNSMGFLVSMVDSTHVNVGCKCYGALWFRYALYNLSNGLLQTVGPISNVPGGVQHNGVSVVFESADVSLLLAALQTLNLSTSS